MMREAFNEAAEKGIVAFRVVDHGVMKENYNETVFEDGVLYMQVRFVDPLGKGQKVLTGLDGRGFLWHKC